MKKYKSLLIMLLILLMTLSTVGCKKMDETKPIQNAETLKIYTTFYPLYDFTDKIVGERAEVVNLTPSGVEPHDFELSPKQTAMLYDADMFIFLGEVMEPWAKKLQSQLISKGVTVVEVGKGLIQGDDPHIWLDPILAKEMSDRIYKGIVTIDKDGEASYKQNLDELLDKFDELDNRFTKTFSQGAENVFITDHAVLGYPAKRYNFKSLAVKGLSPQEEPTPKRLAELAMLCKAEDIKYIFTLKGESSKISESLAQEVGAQILEIDPLESLREEEIKAGEDYFSIMKKNLFSLKKAMNK